MPGSARRFLASIFIDRLEPARAWLSSSWLETGQRREIAVGDAHHLEQPAHAARPFAGQALELAVDLVLLFARGIGLQRGGAGGDAEAAEKIALVDRTVDAGADAFGGNRER